METVGHIGTRYGGTGNRLRGRGDGYLLTAYGAHLIMTAAGYAQQGASYKQGLYVCCRFQLNQRLIGMSATTVYNDTEGCSVISLNVMAIM